MAENTTPAVPQEDEGYEPDLLTLEDEEGKEHTFEVIDALEHKGTHYMALVPYVESEEALEEDMDLLIMKVGQDADGEYVDIVDDDEELYEVSKAFEKRLGEFFEIEQ